VTAGAAGDSRVEIVAAGAVVLRPGPTGVEALLVHRPRLEDWSVPKGKLGEGEHPMTAAVREVAEETGVTAALGRRLDPARYRVGGTHPKLVHYWAATVSGVVAHEPDDEVDELRWFELTEAAATATHRWDRRMLSGLAGRPDPADGIVAVPPVVLLRHGKAVARKGWAAEDPLRPLSTDGERQALALVPLLAALAPGRVLTSPSARCRQTVAPFNRATGRSAAPVPALSEEGFAADPAAAHALVDELLSARMPGNPPVLVCTHRPVLDALLHRLSGRGADPRRLSPAEFVVLTGPSRRPQVDRYPVPG